MWDSVLCSEAIPWTLEGIVNLAPGLEMKNLIQVIESSSLFYHADLAMNVWIMLKS